MLGPTDVSVEDLDLDAEYGKPSDNSQIITQGNETPEDQPESDEDKDDQEESTESNESEESDTEETQEPTTPTGEETETPDDDDTPVVRILSERLGVELDDDQVNGYSDDYDGVAKFIEDFGTQLAEDHIQEELGAVPDVLQYYKHRKSGGAPEDFFNTNHPSVDYSKIDLEKADTATLKQLVSENLKGQGVPDESIKSTIEGAEASGFLKNLAETAKYSLAKQQERAKADFEANQARQIEEQRIAAEELQRQVNTMLDKANNLNGIAVSSRDKKALYDYVMTPVDTQGRTQRDLDASKMTLEQELFIAEIIRRGFDLSGVIDKAVTTKQARNLRDRLTKQDKAKNSKATRPTVPTQFANVDDLDTGT